MGSDRSKAGEPHAVLPWNRMLPCGATVAAQADGGTGARRDPFVLILCRSSGLRAGIRAIRLPARQVRPLAMFRHPAGSRGRAALLQI